MRWTTSIVTVTVWWLRLVFLSLSPSLRLCLPLLRPSSYLVFLHFHSCLFDGKHPYFMWTRSATCIITAAVARVTRNLLGNLLTTRSIGVNRLQLMYCAILPTNFESGTLISDDLIRLYVIMWLLYIRIYLNLYIHFASFIWIDCITFNWLILLYPSAAAHWILAPTTFKSKLIEPHY